MAHLLDVVAVLPAPRDQLDDLLAALADTQHFPDRLPGDVGGLHVALPPRP